jgi:hypothetical protein
MAKASEPAAILVVLDSFDGEVGGETLFFRKGMLFEADHPAVKKWPTAFRPFVFPYPVRRVESRIEQATAAPGEKRGA